MPIPLRLALVAALLLGTGTAQSGDTPPRIGLVLSGGGARGAAHAGVLEVLEELHVPVHCVVGTSMGSIVGGLYAYGLSPQELRQRLTREGCATDWHYLLGDGDGRPIVAYRRKEETRLLTGRIKFGMEGLGLKLPKGWIVGQNLETELHLLTPEAHALRSFDELPLPFRCIAVDIGTGEEVVLDHGDLAQAMRASMALPGVFTPATIDGRELLDGGLVDNVPLGIARGLGCDAFVVVDIGSPLADTENIKNLLDVTSQMFAILTQQNVDRSHHALDAKDILIQPDLGTITSSDFDRAAESIAIGAAAARAVADRLLRYSVDDATWQAWLAHQRRRPAPPPILRAVHVDNHSSMADAVAVARLGLLPGDPVTESALRAGIADLYSIDDLQRARVAIHRVDGQPGAADLDLRLEDKSWGTDSLQFGLSLESDFDATSEFELGVLYTKKHLNSLGAEWRLLLGVGSESAIYTELYQPVVPSGAWFVAPNLFGGDRTADGYVGPDKIAEGKVDYVSAGLDAGRTLGNWGEFRVGYVRAHGTVNLGLNVLGAKIPAVDFDDAALHALVRADTQDDSFFPTSGTLASLEYRLGVDELGGDSGYEGLTLHCERAFSWHDLTAVATVDYDTTLRHTRPGYTTPSLGGFRHLSGLPRHSLNGQHLALGVLELRQRLSTGIAPIYVGATGEVGNTWKLRDEQFSDWRFGGSAYVGVDSPIGPVFLGVGIVEGGEVGAFLFLGPSL